jgi:hypothetical protein
LERGVAAYPYNGILMARLAEQYATDGQAERARKLVAQYRAVFPEDTMVREAEKHLDGVVDVDPLNVRGVAAPITLPR